VLNKSLDSYRYTNLLDTAILVITVVTADKKHFRIGTTVASISKLVYPPLCG
jgi:hypothetical protein